MPAQPSRILLIRNSQHFHLEIIESVIVNYRKIIKSNCECKIFLSLHENTEDESFLSYIKSKYPSVTFGNPPKQNYSIEISFYPKQYRETMSAKKNKCFFISHRVNRELEKTAPNVFYLTPLAKSNVFEASILPFSDKKIETDVPIFVVQGNIHKERRNFDLLAQILKESYDYPFKIKLIGKLPNIVIQQKVFTKNSKIPKFKKKKVKAPFPKPLQKFQNQIIFKENLNFVDFHKEFADCYAILPLITKKSQPQYYKHTLTSSINYAKGYKLKCLIDAELQKIYKLENVVVFNNHRDIVMAFKVLLKDFYSLKKL